MSKITLYKHAEIYIDDVEHWHKIEAININTGKTYQVLYDRKGHPYIKIGRTNRYVAWNLKELIEDYKQFTFHVINEID